MEFCILLTALLLLFGAERLLYRRLWDKRLTYTCRFSVAEAFEGDEIELIEEISNAKWLPLPWAKTEISASRFLDFAGSQSTVSDQTRFVPSFFVLKSYHRVVRRWKVTCLRRGVYTIDKTVIVATDPFGMAAFSLPVRLNAALTVLPRPLPAQAFLPGPTGLSGERIVRRRLISDPFFIAGVREYRPTDAANRIHWAATARAGHIVVRNQDFTSSQSLTVILNMQTAQQESAFLRDEEEIEREISAAATYLDLAAQEQIPIRLLANGGAQGLPVSSACGTGKEHLLGLLRILARMDLTKSEDLAPFLETVPDSGNTTDYILISSYPDAALWEFAHARTYSGARVLSVLTRPYDVQTLPGEFEYAFFLPDAQAKEAAKQEATV